MSIFSDYYGYRRCDFEFMGRSATVVLPKEKNDFGGWLYKTEYFQAFPELELDMLARGYHVAYLANKSRWVVDDDIEVKNAFCAHLEREFGLNPMCVPIGYSCGGMHAVYFASRFPERVAAAYIDAPVLNYLSCPYALGKATDTSMITEFEAHTGHTLSEMINFRRHPIDEAKQMISAAVPLYISGGDSDLTVPYAENGAILADMYRAAGAPLAETVVAGRGHHPHGIEDRAAVIAFIEKYYHG